MRLFRSLAVVSLIAALVAVSEPARAAPPTATVPSLKALPPAAPVAIAPLAVTLAPTAPELAVRLEGQALLLLPTMTTLSALPALVAVPTHETGRCTPVDATRVCADDGHDLRLRV